MSGHRLGLGVDGVLLMGDALVLGRTGDAGPHRSPRSAEQSGAVRNKDRLGVRYPGTLTINGEKHQEQGHTEREAVVAGDDFSLSVEAVTGRMGRG